MRFLSVPSQSNTEIFKKTDFLKYSRTNFVVMHLNISVYDKVKIYPYFYTEKCHQMPGL